MGKNSRDIFGCLQKVDKMISINNASRVIKYHPNTFIYLIITAYFLIISYLDITPIKQVFGFLYLSFYPGYLIVKIIRINKISFIDLMLIALGTSICFLMILGFMLNFIFLQFNNLSPLTESNILLSVTITLLCFNIYLDAYGKNDALLFPLRTILPHSCLKDISKINWLLVLLIIPFISIFGAILVNEYNSSLVLNILMILISFLVISLVYFKKSMDKGLYPIAIFVFSISLLLHKSLISNYLWGWDIFVEHNIYSTIMENLYYDFRLPNNLNGMLSISILPVIYSKTLDISGILIFKIIYPFIFSFVPLAMYQIFQKQFNGKIALLSAFFFISQFTFYDEMLSLGRQEIAELFLVLLLLLQVNKEIRSFQSSILRIFFFFSLIVSHYGLAYIFLFYLLISLIYEVIVKTESEKRLDTSFILYAVFLFSWYQYTTSAQLFTSFVHYFQSIFESIFTELFDISARDPNVLRATGFSDKNINIWHKLNRYYYLIVNLFIFIGVGYVALNKKRMKKWNGIDEKYFLFSLLSFTMILLSIMVPKFPVLNATRVFHITLIFLAPFCIIGGIYTFRLVGNKMFKRFFENINRHMYAVFALLILVPFFLFNVGFVYAVVGDSQKSIALDPYDSVMFTQEKDFVAADWIKSNNNDPVILADYYTYFNLVGYNIFNREHLKRVTKYTHPIENQFVFLRHSNNKANEIYYESYEDSGHVWLHIQLNETEFYTKGDKIYDSGSQIYK